MCNARVYVGTYKKYNNGNLGGGWISLADCKDYTDFLARCKSLHKNESDPEFMIQDSEGFPDGLDCMEWIGEKDFNDVKEAMNETEEEVRSIRIVDYSDKCFAVVGDTFPLREQLKQLGAWKFNKFLSCGAGWLFNNDKREAVEAFIKGAAIPMAEKKEDKGNMFVGWLNEFLETQCPNPSDKKYYKECNVGAVKIDGHFYLIKKPNIENRFCFHDEGPQYDLYKNLTSHEDKMKKYFIAKNESTFTNAIDELKKDDHARIELTDYHNKVTLYYGYGYWNIPDKARNLTSEEKELIINGLEYGLKLFRKRLDTYLKRYGLSKLHTWTYWADA